MFDRFAVMRRFVETQLVMHFPQASANKAIARRDAIGLAQALKSINQKIFGRSPRLFTPSPRETEVFHEVCLSANLALIGHHLTHNRLHEKRQARCQLIWLMLARSVELSRRTDGAFDVTVGPLVQLWRRSRRRKELPSDDLLKETRQSVGYRLIELDLKKRRVRLSRPGMRIDLGGIAKGYAADEARRVLREHGISRVLIDAGGDLVAGDPPPGKNAWLRGRC